MFCKNFSSQLCLKLFYAGWAKFTNFLALALIEKDAGRYPKGRNKKNNTWAGLATWPLSLWITMQQERPKRKYHEGWTLVTTWPLSL
jgi:hypothetical protein